MSPYTRPKLHPFRVCLGRDETHSLLEVFNLFLLLCICLITLFSIIYGFYCTIQLTFSFFFLTVLSVKSFQFQLNKLFSNKPLAYCPCKSINKTHVFCYKSLISNIMKKKNSQFFLQLFMYITNAPLRH